MTFLLVLDGFDQLNQASVHFPLAIGTKKSWQHRNIFSGMLRIEARTLFLRYVAKRRVKIKFLRGLGFEPTNSKLFSSQYVVPLTTQLQHPH